jgi:hypothetical protein
LIAHRRAEIEELLEEGIISIRHHGRAAIDDAIEKGQMLPYRYLSTDLLNDYGECFEAAYAKGSVVVDLIVSSAKLALTSVNRQLEISFL